MFFLNKEQFVSFCLWHFCDRVMKSESLLGSQYYLNHHLCQQQCQWILNCNNTELNLLTEHWQIYVFTKICLINTETVVQLYLIGAPIFYMIGEGAVNLYLYNMGEQQFCTLISGKFLTAPTGSSCKLWKLPNRVTDQWRLTQPPRSHPR